jgi:hypothetical protein
MLGNSFIGSLVSQTAVESSTPTKNGKKRCVD